MNQMNNVGYKYILVDTTNLFFKCYFSIIKGNDISLLTTEEISDVVNLQFELTKFLIREFGWIEDTEIFFLVDNSQSKINIRKALDEEYKSFRDKKNLPQNIYAILKFFLNIMKVYSNNFRVLYAENLEADDLTKPLIEWLYPKINNTLVVSDDLDWARNIDDRVHWYNWKRVYNKDEFFKKYGFFPTTDRICLYKAVLGDVSDSIKAGIPRFPKKDMIEILNRYDSLDDVINDESNTNSKSINLIRSNLYNIKKNINLVNFLDVSRPIQEYISYSKKDAGQCKLLFNSLNMEIPLELMDSDELEENFFKIT